MNKSGIIKEVRVAENQLTSFLRRGDIMKGVAMHLKSPDYRNIWNGEVKTYDQLVGRLKKGLEAGLKNHRL